VEVVPATARETGAHAWMALTDPNDWSDKPRWSPDGRAVYFVRRTDGYWNVWRVRFDPIRGRPIGPPIQVTRFSNPELEISPLFGMADIEVSPKSLILTMMERSGSVWTVDVDR
jgi:dipeptidyl aminopeptidase/acylaminoacyl peptidase